MPLDTGEFAINPPAAAVADELAPLRPAKITLNPHGEVGAALREARLGLGLAVEDIASATRVRSGYITAIETSAHESLPARPFVIGYVRAYARALGLDPEVVVVRFRGEAPPVDSHLGAPGPLGDQGSRLGWLTAAVMVVAVVGWNVTRHVKPPRARPPVAASRAIDQMRAIAGPAQLGAPPPAPPEAANPPAYETPGLSAAGPSQTPAAPPTGAPFVAAGAVYGAPGPGLEIVLQARKPTSLIIRGPGQSVYFARELAAGEAWRAPAMAGLTADVGDPAAVEVFVNGISRGALSEPQTPLARLGG